MKRAKLRFGVGDRVHYVVYPFKEASTDVAGTVVDVVRGGTGVNPTPAVEYHVYWDGVDRARFPATVYRSADLERAKK